MRKKLFAILLVLAMIATVFAGCSGSTGEDDTKKDRKESSRERDDEDDEDTSDIDLESVFSQLLDKEDKNNNKEDIREDNDDDDNEDVLGFEDLIPKKEEKVIRVMSFKDDVPKMVQMYLDMHPELGYTMEATIVATTDGAYQPALDWMLKTGGEEAPDIYAVEAAFVSKYTQGDASPFAATYEELGIDIDRMMWKSKTAPYAAEIGTRPSDNEVVGLPYQSTGGCFIYRRSIAKDVWGTDDPAYIQQMIGGGSGNWDMFWNAAEELKQKGYGIISGDGDIWHALENSADTGWIVDGKLNIDPRREVLLDVSKKLKDNDYHNETKDWQYDWFMDMQGEGEKEVFGFFGPAWLINYTMAYNCGDDQETTEYEGTFGDWAVCNSPVGFHWGGTWVLAHEDVVDMKKKDVVADILQWITLDYDENSLQYMWANGTFNGVKDTVVSGSVMEISDGTMDFLGGQNMFDYYVDANQQATGRNITPHDETINTCWREAVRDYVEGTVDRDGAIAQFKSQLRGRLDITIE